MVYSFYMLFEINKYKFRQKNENKYGLGEKGFMVFSIERIVPLIVRPTL